MLPHLQQFLLLKLQDRGGDEMTIGFIGLGNMAKAMIGGILAKGLMGTNEIIGTAATEASRQKAAEKFGIQTRSSNEAVAKEADIIILAVKPQYLKGVIAEIMDCVDDSKVVVSIAAGKTISWYAQEFEKPVKVIRVMPNTPAIVGESMSVLCGSDGISNDRMASAQQIFDSVGKTAIMAESYLDAVTGLSGSGPAYIYLIIEALTSGGVWAGLPKPIAQQLAVQTVKGTVAMIEENPDKAIEDLRHAVTSPGGTTIAGLAALERHGVRNAIMEAVKDAADRSAELGKR